jgi:hypothetical protein
MKALSAVGEIITARNVILNDAMQARFTGQTELANKLYSKAGQLKLIAEEKIYGRVS